MTGKCAARVLRSCFFILTGSTAECGFGASAASLAIEVVLGVKDGLKQCSFFEIMGKELVQGSCPRVLVNSG